ncbi:MAG: hypothetical protein ACOX63_12945 [Christensenellales bacterium]|jgi:hypothetical protein
MKHILAFDDFVLNRSDNTRRVFKQPKWYTDLAYTDAANPRGIWPSTVVPAPGGGYMLTYGGVPGASKTINDENMMGFMAWSEDGLRFAPLDSVNPQGEYPHMTGATSGNIGLVLYLDKTEKNPERRYKSPHARYGYKDGILVEDPPHMLASPDLIHWHQINDAPIVPSFVDCTMSLLRNPVTGRYQVTTRRRWGERRICLVESVDLEHWSLPRAIVHPLPSDEPLTHLYSMPHYYYEAGDIFIGLLWKQVMPFGRVMDGPVFSEYAYSYDGLLWNRTHAPIFPVMDRGEYGGGSCYVVSMLEREDDILFYAAAHRAEHGGNPRDWQAGMPPESVLIPGTMKRNRFVCIDAGKGKANLVTQWLRLKTPSLTLNANVPFGSLRAQLSADGPIPGYTYDDFIPLGGDHLDAPLRWNGGALDEFVQSGRWIQLHFAFEQAEVYAISGEFDFTINTRAPAYERL